MKIGLIGLGKMGQAIAHRLIKNKHQVIGYDPKIKPTPISKLNLAKNISVVAEKTNIIWLMVPAGKIVDNVISKLLPHLKTNSILIDGGNSFFKDTQRRYKKLTAKKISFVDCGTSGGVPGKKTGFCLMIGGDKTAFNKIKPILKSIAAPNGFEYFGPSGSGHYVKMIHNGIEYSILQAYAEGFHLLKQNSNYKKLDLEKITKTWMNGSVIRSWVLELCQNIFAKDQELKKLIF